MLNFLNPHRLGKIDCCREYKNGVEFTVRMVSVIQDRKTNSSTEHSRLTYPARPFINLHKYLFACVQQAFFLLNRLTYYKGKCMCLDKVLLLYCTRIFCTWRGFINFLLIHSCPENIPERFLGSAAWQKKITGWHPVIYISFNGVGY